LFKPDILLILYREPYTLFKELNKKRGEIFMGLFVSNKVNEVAIDTPTVNVKERLKKIEITGKSRMTDPGLFYNELLQTLENNFQKFKHTLIIEFRYEYINTGSSKWLYHVLSHMQNLVANEGMIEIYWYYDEDDEIIFEAGEVLQSILKIPFHLREN